MKYRPLTPWQVKLIRRHESEQRERRWAPVLLAIALGLLAGLALCWKAGWM